MEHTYYTDGSCLKNPDGPGGWAAVEITPDLHIKKLFHEYLPSTTNNRCELLAILSVLKEAAANPNDTYIIYSDSAYAINSINTWIYGWAVNGWKTSKGKTVENIDIMKDIYSLLINYNKNFSICKVKAHVGVIENEFVDGVARGDKEKIKSAMIKNHIIIDNL